MCEQYECYRHTCFALCACFNIPGFLLPVRYADVECNNYWSIVVNLLCLADGMLLFVYSCDALQLLID